MRVKGLIFFLAISTILGIIFVFFFLQKQERRLFLPTNLVLSRKGAASADLEEKYTPLLPSLDRIFEDDHTWASTLSAEKKITLIATGDVILARGVNYRAVMVYHDFLWPWKRVADTLKSADVTLINLESPIFAGCEPVDTSTFVFCGEAKHLDGLLFAGVDAASLANNHSGNFGATGIRKTEELLNTGGITSFGVVDPVYRTFKNIKFAFLGYNDVGAKINEERMVREVKEARGGADLVVVEFHWGTEYVTPPEERQKYLGKLAIDSGADLVVGNHPHWIKPIEFYHGKLITYGHGNFIFDQEWSEKTKEGVVGKYTFYERQLIDVEYLPVRIEDYGQPRFLDGLEKRRILDEMKEASLKPVLK